MENHMTWRKAWDTHYARNVAPGRERITGHRGVALMFHSVLDGRLAIRSGMIERILEREPDVLAEVVNRWGDVPDEIYTPADLILGFIASFRDGRAMQRMIRAESVYRWALDVFGYDELALGGTSANMAVAVSGLGVPRVLVYANPLTAPLAEAFPNDQALTTIGPSGEVGSPRDVARGDEVFAIHWILEYQTGDTLTIGPHTLTALRANRFIPSWNPANNQLALAESFTRTFLRIAPEFGHLLLSGFHILSDAYPDGSTALDCIRPVAEYVREVKDHAPTLKAHCELASIAGSVVRKGVLEEVLPLMDSVGLNEAELMSWLSDLGKPELARRIDNGDAKAALEGVAALAETTGIPRVHLHNLGYFIALVDKNPESVRQGLLTGASAAIVRAGTGRPARNEELKAFTEMPFYEGAESAMRSVAEAVESEDFVTSGIGRLRDRFVVMVPTRIVENPVRTVGLGDTISASSWLAEQE